MEGFFDTALPTDVDERAADRRNGALAPVNLHGFTDKPALGRGIGKRVEAMPHDLAQKRKKPFFTAICIEDLGKPVDQFLEFVEARGRDFEECLQIPRVVTFPVKRRQEFDELFLEVGGHHSALLTSRFTCPRTAISPARISTS